MKKVLLIVCILMLFCGVAGAKADNIQDGATDTASFIVYLSSESAKLDNGIVINFNTPSIWWGGETRATPNYYSQKSTAWINGGLYAIKCGGTGLKITNTSSQIYIIKWAESSISIGRSNGIPFLDGVKWKDAGNPSATPESIIPPGGSIDKTVFLPSVAFDSYRATWSITGEPIPKDNSLRVVLCLKISDGNGVSKYYTAQSPTLGLMQM